MYCENCGKYSGRYPLCKDCYYEEAEYKENEDICEICGDNSYGYPLCKTCYYKVKEYVEEHYEDFIEYDEENYEYTTYTQGHCISCNKIKENNDFFLCTECYKKYHNKELIISLINAKEIKILDSRYYNKYRCFDGHMVKSKSEREIDNYLFKKNIRHIYEKPIPINANEDDDIHPDFFLYDLDVYIEHLGKEGDPEYDERTQYKVNIYKDKKLTVIFTHENTDAKDMQSALERKLKNYKKGQINYL